MLLIEIAKYETPVLRIVHSFWTFKTQILFALSVVYASNKATSRFSEGLLVILSSFPFYIFDKTIEVARVTGVSHEFMSG